MGTFTRFSSLVMVLLMHPFESRMLHKGHPPARATLTALKQAESSSELARRRYTIFDTFETPLSFQHEDEELARARYTIYFSESPQVVSLVDLAGNGFDPHSQDAAMKWMSYWQPPSGVAGRRTVENLRRHASSSTSTISQSDTNERFLSFETDTGGFNNIRIAFEFFLDLATGTGRTLVLPPKEGWYLLDWGPLKANNKGGDEGWIHGKPESSYDEFFDMNDLRKRIPLISAEEFYHRFHHNTSAQEQGSLLQSLMFFRPSVFEDQQLDVPFTKLANTPDPSPWKDWLTAHAASGSESGVPSSCEEALKLAEDTSVAHVHLPSGKHSDVDYRFFGCNPTFAQTPKLMLHYNPKFYGLANRAVSSLGVGRYAALHLRRNDFQYKQAPSAEGAEKLVRQLDKLLQKKEPIYLATDETDAAWFEGFRKLLNDRGHKVRRLQDFLPHVEMRHSGPVEMIICAGARIFLGTHLSTFTGGIQEMRTSIANAHGPIENNAETNETIVSLEGQDDQYYHAEKIFIEI